jgi:tripartite-type tricarboxylate transporter receptor subunit TctC
MIGRRMLGVGLAASFLAAPALAQDVPRTITLVVPFSAGSVIDLMARSFADAMRTTLGAGSTIVVMNRDGGTGTVGAGAVASARPDGSMLYFGPSGMLTTLPHMTPGLAYGWGALEPVCQTFENIFLVIAPPNSPHRTLADVLAVARADPEAVNWGDAGPGTVGHLIVTEIMRRSGVRMTHVPYRNTTQQVLDTRTGILTFSMTTWATTRESGLRVLAAVSDERLPFLSDVPTLKELGFDVNWRGFGGVMAPRGTPPALVARLEAACLAAVRSEGYLAFMHRAGQVAPPLGAADFGARLQAEHADAAIALREMGLAR